MYTCLLPMLPIVTLEAMIQTVTRCDLRVTLHFQCQQRILQLRPILRFYPSQAKVFLSTAQGFIWLPVEVHSTILATQCGPLTHVFPAIYRRHWGQV